MPTSPRRTLIITGASRGIGRAIAEEFARRGHRVVATARDPRSLADLDVSQRLALDVTDDASVTAAFAAAGDVDIVIVNPAEIFYAAVEAIPLTELQRLFNLNTVGALRVAQAVLPQMRARGEGKFRRQIQQPDSATTANLLSLSCTSSFIWSGTSIYTPWHVRYVPNWNTPYMR